MSVTTNWCFCKKLFSSFTFSSLLISILPFAKLDFLSFLLQLFDEKKYQLQWKSSMKMFHSARVVLSCVLWECDAFKILFAIDSKMPAIFVREQFNLSLTRVFDTSAKFYVCDIIFHFERNRRKKENFIETSGSFHVASHVRWLVCCLHYKSLNHFVYTLDLLRIHRRWVCGRRSLHNWDYSHRDYNLYGRRKYEV